MIYRSPYPDVAIPEIAYSDYILADVDRWADQTAFIDGPSGRSLSFAQVRGGARKVAASLAARGFAKGDRFAIFCPNLPEYAMAFHGAALAGSVVTTASPLLTADELAAQLNDTGARFLLTVPPFIETARQAAARAKVEELFVLGQADGATPFGALLATDAAPPAVAIDPRADLLVLPYSSGTSGRSKGVMLTHYNAVAALAQFDQWPDPKAGNRIIAVLPFFHIYGLQLLNGALRRGACCVTMPRFDLEQYLRLIEQHRVEVLYTVPPMVLALARHPLVDSFDLSSVRKVGCGAAPLDAALQHAAETRLKAHVGQGMGMTEVGFALAAQPPDAVDWRAGDCGLLMPNMQARIVDVDSGADLGPNQPGELWVRGPGVMRGYLNNPEATRATIDADGWLHSGDIALFDDDGRLHVVDRLKELIKYKAYQVAPAALEGVLLQHPAVADAAVIGVPDEAAGEIPKAYVVPRGGAAASAEEIMAFVATRVAPHERVRALEFIDAIPKALSGKILRRVLRERAAGQAAA